MARAGGHGRSVRVMSNAVEWRAPCAGVRPAHGGVACASRDANVLGPRRGAERWRGSPAGVVHNLGPTQGSP